MGVAFDLPAGTTLNPGLVEVSRLEFAAQTSATGETAITFGDQPVQREVADATAEALDTSFEPSSVVLGPSNTGPPLRFDVSGQQLLLHWAAADSEGFELESTGALESDFWTRVQDQPIVIGGQKLVTVSINGQQRFFRLKKE